jgi:two-component system nitrate/nitrite response regulator NarL
VPVPVSCLLVDDSAEFLAAAASLLSAQGFTVVGQAASGDEARRLARELRPDVALVDVELGDEDGIETARRLTADDPALTVVLISLRDRNELAELLVGSGAAGFLRKDTLDARAVTDLMVKWGQRDAGPVPRD